MRAYTLRRLLALLPTLFIVVAGVLAVLRPPIAALPDLSDVQVIVYTEVPGQAPQERFQR